MEAGCDGYITKPIEVVSFFEQVCAYLPNPSAASETGDE
jgi:hypothetical protein